MPNPPLITVLLPTFRRAAGGYLQRSIDSVLGQSLTDFELLVVDDASIDGSAGLIADYAARDPRVVHHRLDRNVGLPALTTATAYASAARGELIVMTFDDCLLRERHLEVLSAALARHEDAPFSYGMCEAHWPAGPSLMIGKPFSRDEMRLGQNHIPNAGVMMRRRTIETFGWYDPHILLKRFCDWDLWWRIGRDHEPLFLPEVVCDEFGTGLDDSLGSQVTVFRDLMLRYAGTDRRGELSPAALTSLDPLRTAIGLPLSGTDREAIEFLGLEHLIATANNDALLERYGDGGDPALTLTRLKADYFARRLTIVSTERSEMWQRLLTVEPLFEAERGRLRAEADQLHIVDRDRLAAAAAELDESREETAACRLALDERSQQFEREHALVDELRRASKHGSALLRSAKDRAERAEAEIARIGERLDAAFADAQRVADERSDEQSLSAQRQAALDQAGARIAQIEAELTLVEQELTAARRDVAEGVTELNRVNAAWATSRADLAARLVDLDQAREREVQQRQFWSSRQDFWIKQRDILADRLRDSERRQGDLKRHLGDLTAANAALTERSATVAATLDEAEERNERLVRYADALATVVQAIRNAPSWRLTAPVRKMMRVMGREGRIGPLPVPPHAEVLDKAPEEDGTGGNVPISVSVGGVVGVAVDQSHNPRVRRVVAIGDGPISSVELCLNVPLEFMQYSFGVQWRIFYQDNLPAIEECRQADLVIMMRVMTAAAAELAETLGAEGIPLLYSTDDDLELLTAGSALHAHYQRMGAERNLRTIVASASLVQVYSLSLARRFGARHPRVKLSRAVSGIELYDTLPDVERTLDERGEIRIGYAGSQTHDADVQIILPVLTELLDRDQRIVVETIGQRIAVLDAHPRYRHFEGVLGLPAYSALQHSRDWDIALAPLVLSRFNEGKSDNKFRSYAAAGIAGVYTRIEPFVRAVDHDVTGLLVDNTTSAWVAAVESLIIDADKRRRIATAARSEARKRLSISAIAHDYHSLYEEATEGLRVLVVGNLFLPTVKIDAKLPMRELQRRGIVRSRFREVLATTDQDLVWADALVVIRAVGQPVLDLLKRAAEQSLKTIYSWDDDYFSIPEEFKDLHAFHSRADIIQSTEDILRGADLIKASTSRIAQRSLKYNRNVMVASYGFDFGLIVPAESFEDDGRVRVGYYGSVGRGTEMEPVYEALSKIMTEFDHVELVFFGLEPAMLRRPDRFTAIPFTDVYEDSIRDLATSRLDIGVSPLPMTDLARAKLPTKYRDYGATRIAGIYTDVEPYSEIIRHGENGLLTDNSVEGWYQAIKRLILDPELRERIASAAYDDVRRNHSLDVAIEAWSSAFRRLGFAIPR